jgi:hypothetical protein
MGTESINEPVSSRDIMLTPLSLNEPPPFTDLPDAAPPVVTLLEPAEATIGDPSFTLYVTGEQFDASSSIFFAGYTEPTTLEQDGRLSTGINMDVWLGPDTVKVSVFNEDRQSNEVDFTFLPGARAAADPDDLEEEIEEAEDEGEFTAIHASKTTVVKKSKKTKR